MKTTRSTKNQPSITRRLIHTLAESFGDAGGIYAFIWLTCFIAILIMMDQPLNVPMIFVAAFLAIPAIYLTTLLIGIPLVLLDGILDIIDEMRKDIRRARKYKQEREQHYRRLP